MYIIKQLPEDFIVREIAAHRPLDSGPYALCMLKKRNCTTQRAVEQIARALFMGQKLIGYAGLKDKKAVTYQYITIKGKGKRHILNISLDGIELGYLGSLNSPIGLGDLEGNSFEIIIRNIKSRPRSIAQFPNLFGEQRFSTNNVKIGKAIVKKDFKSACLMIQDDSDYGHKVSDYLCNNTKDYVGALKTVPIKILKLYVHSFQSHIWNRTMERIDFKVDKIPLIGFDTCFDDSRVQDIVKRIMKDEDVRLSDFLIRQIPPLSLEGDGRKAFVDLADLSIGELEDDDLNPDMSRCKVSFTLPKGSYATVALRYLDLQ